MWVYDFKKIMRANCERAIRKMFNVSRYKISIFILMCNGYIKENDVILIG